MIHPAPLVACRAAEPDEVPRTAAALERKAQAAGWRCRTTYAHGTNIGAQGQPSGLIESVVVRMRRDPLAAVASWHNGSFASAWVWSRYTSPRRIGARELSRFVGGPA